MGSRIKILSCQGNAAKYAFEIVTKAYSRCIKSLGIHNSCTSGKKLNKFRNVSNFGKLLEFGKVWLHNDSELND